MRRKSLWLSLLIATVMLSNVHAAPAGPEVSGSLYYFEDFSENAGGWNSYVLFGSGRPCTSAQHIIPWWPGNYGCLTPMQWQNDGTVSISSPFWIYPIFMDPARGYVHILAKVHTASYYGGIGQSDLNLQNIFIRLRAKSDLNIASGQIYFYYHTYAPAVDGDLYYVLSAYPLNEMLASAEWTDITLPLDSDEVHWTCLGWPSWDSSTPVNCQPPADTLTSINGDFGLMLWPVDADQPATGTISLDEVEIYTSRISFPAAEMTAEASVPVTVTIQFETPADQAASAGIATFDWTGNLVGDAQIAFAAGQHSLEYTLPVQLSASEPFLTLKLYNPEGGWLGYHSRMDVHLGTLYLGGLSEICLPMVVSNMENQR